MLRKTRSDVVKLVVENGGSRDAAEAIADTLAEAGLSPADSRSWLSHPNKAYGIITGSLTIGDIEHPLKQTPIFAIEDGKEDAVLEAVRQFAAASDDERFISWWFGGNLDEVRRLTGGDPQRASTIRAIAERLRDVLRKPDRVGELVQTQLPGHDDRRIVDLLIEGQEGVVRDDLAAGRIDPRALLEDGFLDYRGW